MENATKRNTVSMTETELKLQQLKAAQDALGELLIEAAEVITEPAAMLAIAGVAHRTIKEYEKELFEK